MSTVKASGHKVEGKINLLKHPQVHFSNFSLQMQICASKRLLPRSNMP